MTLAELERAFQSKARTDKARAQEKATFDYILADLIGRSVARVFSSGNTYPEIAKVYPSLFDKEELEEKRKEEKAKLSELRLHQFAKSFNKKFQKEGKQKDE